MSPSRRMLMSLRDSDASVRGSLESDLPCRRLDKAMESRVLLSPRHILWKTIRLTACHAYGFGTETVCVAYG